MPASGVQVADVLAAATLFLLVAAPIALAAFLVARSRMNPLQCVLWVLGYSLCKLLWRTRWVNDFPLAEGQGAVIICNHRSSVDPFFVQCATGAKIHWMVARE